MGQRTITLPPDLEAAIEDYFEEAQDNGDLSELVGIALWKYLSARRYELEIINPDRPHRFLKITPAEKGSGLSDVSVNHDKYLAEDLMTERERE